MNGSLMNLSTLPVTDFSVIWVIVKWVMVFSAALFVVFSLVVMAQIRQMVVALRRDFNMLITTIGWIYFAITVLVLLIAMAV